MKQASRRNRCFIPCVCVAAALLVVLRVFAATLIVDGDGGTPFQTIQSAIDAAVPGQDEVFVRCGVYAENLVMRDDVPLRGQSPDCTVIDGGQQAVTVSMDDLGSGTRLEGFTVRNGFDSSGAGGGVRILGGSPVITRNVIENNGQFFVSSGAGVLVSGLGSLTPTAPVISYNVIRDNDGFWGAGVLLYYADGARLTSNLIVRNAAYYGGGVFARGYGDTAYVTNNTIIGNTAYLGAGLTSYEPTVIVTNNAIVNNEALISAGGVWLFYCDANFANNNVFGNSPDDTTCPVDPTGINGNISAEPRFSDQNDDGFAGFQPRSDSVMVDAGAVTIMPSKDLRGIPRPVDGTAAGVARPDMGARENEGLTRLFADAIGDWHWDRGNHIPEDYHVFRGDLGVLRATGIYTQDPITTPGARHFCDISSSLADIEEPIPGRGYFYLPVAWGSVVGTLGFDSDLVERPRTLECQGP